jgi:hypothetical protein
MTERTKSQKPKVQDLDITPDAEAAVLRSLFAAEEAMERAKVGGDDDRLLEALNAHVAAVELYARLKRLIK